MAKTAKKPTVKWTNSKSAKSARKPAGRKVAKPAEPEIVLTREELLAQIGQVLDQVDVIMAERSANIVQFNRWDMTVSEPAKTMEVLVARLDKLMNPTNRHDLPGGTDAIRDAFGAQPGTVPSWTRPGTFLLWIGYVPCRCIWGGFADHVADVVAATTAEKWLAPSGAINAAVQIRRSYHTPADLFRAFLTAQTERRSTVHRGGKEKDLGPAFLLHPLADLGKQAVEKELSRPENAWLVAALKRGPVEPIPLPPHLAAVQMSWIG